MQLSHYEWDPEKDFLGHGFYNEVFKAKDLSNPERFAALKISKQGYSGSSFAPLSRLEEEFEIGKHLKHENIIKYYDIDFLKGVDHLGRLSSFPSLILEYAPLGNLLNLRKIKKEDYSIKEIILSILEGLQYLHSQNILHGDLKPQNILLTKNDELKIIPKICDLDSSIPSFILKDKTYLLDPHQGTFPYMSPEQYDSKFGKTGKSSEVWSLGVLIYQMISGGLPFWDELHQELRKKILNDEPNFEGFQNKLKAVLKGCLTKKTWNRFQSVSEVIAQIKNIAENEFGFQLDNKRVIIKGDLLADKNSKVSKIEEELKGLEIGGIVYDLVQDIIGNRILSWKIFDQRLFNGHEGEYYSLNYNFQSKIFTIGHSFSSHGVGINNIIVHSSSFSEDALAFDSYRLRDAVTYIIKNFEPQRFFLT